MDVNEIASLVGLLSKNVNLLNENMKTFHEDMKNQFKDMKTQMKNLNKSVDRLESTIKGFKIESEIETEIIIVKESTINTDIDDFITELENSCLSNNNDNDTFQSSSVTLDEIDEFLNSLPIGESPKVLGDSQVEWDDDIIFDHDNIVPQEETIVSIANYPNSYDIVPMGDNTIVTMQTREVESVDVDYTDSEMELTMANTFEVQKLPSNPTKVGEENIFSECAEKQMLVAAEAVSEESFKDIGEAIRRVWDPGVNNRYGEVSSI